LNKLTCAFKGCQTSIEVDGLLASAVRYTCRLHTGKNPIKDVSFQEAQFDPRIGAGTDPRSYESGRGLSGGKRLSGDKSDEPRHSSSAPRKFIERVIKKAGPELASHENRAEIVEILKEDIRDHNVGVAKTRDE
jgi:hypothetical protein